MLTTIIYRSHICENVPIHSLQDMIVDANLKNSHAGVTGILLFNGTHLFQLIEGPEESVQNIYQDICQDKRHYNLVELLRDYAPARRFGNVGMELFDLREHNREEVLQRVLDRGTSEYRLVFHDRALQFFRTFVESREKENYFEIPPGNSWAFIQDEGCLQTSAVIKDSAVNCNFAFQPIIDPLSQKVVSIEALIRTPAGELPDAYFSSLPGSNIYEADLKSKKVALAMAGSLSLKEKTLSLNLLPLTLVMIPDAVNFLLEQINANGLVPEQIIIEFTESEVISRLDEFTQAVRELKAAGIRVAIDHFGEGVAGLLLLAQFQPDWIKINRELVMNVHKSGPRQAIIQAIINCCSSLEISVVAEGVEKAEEWMWLESAGISQFQGHLFARPMLGGVSAVAWPERPMDF